MDTFSHALWGWGLFGFRGFPWLALFFGALPDLLSFGMLSISRFFSGTFTFGPPKLESIPAWTISLYNCTHSLVIACIVVSIVYVQRKDIGFAMFAWPFHILLDIPFHEGGYFPTKMFWPLSDFFIDGVPWHTPWVWIPNLAGLLAFFFYRWLQRRTIHNKVQLSSRAVRRGKPRDWPHQCNRIRDSVTWCSSLDRFQSPV